MRQLAKSSEANTKSTNKQELAAKASQGESDRAEEQASKKQRMSAELEIKQAQQAVETQREKALKLEAAEVFKERVDKASNEVSTKRVSEQGSRASSAVQKLSAQLALSQEVILGLKCEISKALGRMSRSSNYVKQIAYQGEKLFFDNNQICDDADATCKVPAPPQAWYI